MQAVTAAALAVVLAAGASAGATTASWYGADFHGRTTASGEIYNMHDITAAHTKLPLGTRLLVYRADDPRTRVWVQVNDRGPWCLKALAAGRLVSHPERGVDLSRAAFALLAPLTEGLLDVYIQPYIPGTVPDPYPVPWAP